MAFYKDSKYLVDTSPDEDYWNSRYLPGEEVPVSGIYICTRCKKEVTCNKGDPFPPNDHGHSSSSRSRILAKMLEEPKWKLIIKTNTMGA